MPGIVIHKTRSVYWPIPKNACSTMKRQVCRIEGIDPGTNVHTAGFEWTKLRDYNGYMNFSIVRNPYSRLFSLWEDKIIENASRYNGVPDPNVFGHFGDKFKLGVTFNEFVHTIISVPYREADPHFSLQVFQVPFECKVVKIENIAPITFGLFESINVTKDQDYRRAYTANIQDLVYQHYKEDFIRFGYNQSLYEG